MTGTEPTARPAMLRKIAVDFLAAKGVKTFPALLGSRGFSGTNTIGGYDDALWLVTADNIYGFNANTDPSAEKQGMATLSPGTYLYKLGVHHPDTPKAYPCLVQAASVTITRYGFTGTYTGEFYIHIHKGGRYTTSSEGCQTIIADQWDEFYKRVLDAITLSGKKTIFYVLTERNAG